MARILIIYSTTDGHTRKIGKRLQQVDAQAGHEAVLVSVDDEMQVDLASFDKIVIGASIRYGLYKPAIIDFVVRNKQVLDSKPSAFYSVTVVARTAEKREPDANPYMQKFFRQTAWQPKELAVFAGKLDYPRYRFIDRQLIRLIMLMTKGPTDSKAVIEFTDWQQVEAFGRRVCEVPA
ncbi:MAG: menaquinone-dependent protoporphyrinogen IX dehydrogenase [Chromatiales bacterium]|nr:menaquinone-dependent protoporphyrinogen IX dehydrogenase [Chromatiales bacterium]